MKMISFKEWIVRKEYPETVTKLNDWDSDAFSRSQHNYDNMSPGDDEINCPECRGNGYIECPECGDLPDKNCKMCNGSGQVDCKLCGGAGEVSQSDAKAYYDDRRD